jgi:hypothetical protein
MKRRDFIALLGFLRRAVPPADDKKGKFRCDVPNAHRPRRRLAVRADTNAFGGSAICR